MTPGHCHCDSAHCAPTDLHRRSRKRSTDGEPRPTAPDDTASSALIGLLTSWRGHLTAQRMGPATLDTCSSSIRRPRPRHANAGQDSGADGWLRGLRGLRGLRWRLSRRLRGWGRTPQTEMASPSLCFGRDVAVDVFLIERLPLDRRETAPDEFQIDERPGRTGLQPDITQQPAGSVGLRDIRLENDGLARNEGPVGGQCAAAHRRRRVHPEVSDLVPLAAEGHEDRVAADDLHDLGLRGLAGRARPKFRGRGSRTARSGCGWCRDLPAGLGCSVRDR
jgi:hypothetical protein